MRKWIHALILMAVLLIPTTAHSQEGQAKFSFIEVDLWPEYDRPDMLVIYRITLSSETPPPVEMSLRIPAAAGKPNAVAARQMDGVLIDMVHETRIVGEWEYIDFTATTPEIQVEYYDPALEKLEGARHFEYVWPGGYAVDSMTILVQQPIGASDLRISPAMGSGVIGNDGLTYYSTEVGSLLAGQSVRVSLDYRKDTDALTVESLTVQPSAPIAESPSTSPDLLQLLPWIIGVLGAVLIVGGLWWYWRTGQQRPLPKSRRPRRSHASRLTPEMEQPGPQGDIYCHQCGNRAHSGDRFCRACGTQLRSG